MLQRFSICLEVKQIVCRQHVLQPIMIYTVPGKYEFGINRAEMLKYPGLVFDKPAHTQKHACSENAKPIR